MKAMLDEKTCSMKAVFGETTVSMKAVFGEKKTCTMKVVFGETTVSMKSVFGEMRRRGKVACGRAEESINYFHVHTRASLSMHGVQC
jgi:hypothetical protein